MYCYRCGTHNYSNVNFCYNCGVRLLVESIEKVNVPRKIKADINFFNFSLYNKIINSRNKYWSVYFFILSFVLSVSFFTILCKQLPNNFMSVIDLIYNNSYMGAFFFKGYLEQCCRDLWCRFFLIIIFFWIMILDVLVFFRLLKWYKNKKNNF